MKAFVSWMVLVLVMICTGCQTVNITYDYDPNMDFSEYKTYTWYTKDIKGDKLARNPLVKKRVVFATNNNLKEKGLTLIESGKSDLILVAHSGKNDEPSLILDFVDVDTKELVWRSEATEVDIDYDNPEKRQTEIDKLIARMLAQFPPTPQ